MVDRSVSLTWIGDTPFRLLLGTVIGRRWLIAGPAVVAIVLATAWLRTTPAEYRATMVVGSTATLDRAAGGDRATGSSAGSPVNDFSRFLALTTSVAAARQLAEQDWVLPALFPESWDEATARWYPPGGLGPKAERLAARLLGRDGWSPPGPEALAERLGERLQIGPVGGSGLQRIGLRHRDRETALRLLSLVHATADQMVRQSSAARADGQITYLRQRLTAVDLVEHRRTLETLLLDQERQRMLIQADLPYAAALLERPFAPTQADWPNPVLVFALATFCGIFCGLMFAFAADGFRSAPPPR